MAKSSLKQEDDPRFGACLVLQGKVGRSCYVARITDTHPQYRYERQFLGRVRVRGSLKIVRVPLEELPDGALVEIGAQGLWHNADKHYYVWHAGQLVAITEERLQALLKEEHSS